MTIMPKRDLYFICGVFGVLALMIAAMVFYIVSSDAWRVLPAWTQTDGDSTTDGEEKVPEENVQAEREAVTYIDETGELVLDRELLGIDSEEYTITEEPIMTQDIKDGPVTLESFIYTLSFTMPSDIPSNEINRFVESDNAGVSHDLTFSGEERTLTVESSQPMYFDVAFDDASAKINVMPLKEKYDRIVYIDPGHGNYIDGRLDQGAVRSGVQEMDLNLQVANMVKEILEKEAPEIHPIISRTEDVVYSRHERAALASAMADIFVSIHCNVYGEEGQDNDVSGTEVHYNKNFTMSAGQRNSISSAELATILLKDVCAAAGTRERGIVHREDLAITNQSKIPCAIVEMGYISNAPERARLGDPSNQELFAKGISGGIMEAFGLE